MMDICTRFRVYVHYCIYGLSTIIHRIEFHTVPAVVCYLQLYLLIIPSVPLLVGKAM